MSLYGWEIWVISKVPSNTLSSLSWFLAEGGCPWEGACRLLSSYVVLSINSDSFRASSRFFVSMSTAVECWYSWSSSAGSTSFMQLSQSLASCMVLLSLSSALYLWTSFSSLSIIILRLEIWSFYFTICVTNLECYSSTFFCNPPLLMFLMSSPTVLFVLMAGIDFVVVYNDPWNLEFSCCMAILSWVYSVLSFDGISCCLPLNCKWLWVAKEIRLSSDFTRVEDFKSGYDSSSIDTSVGLEYCSRWNLLGCAWTMLTCRGLSI